MLHFESNNFLDDEDESFVSIDLNDNEDECEICHQKTEERIVRVILSDEFLKFEGSFERTGDKLTRAHQICLDRWSDIIERNLKYSNESMKPQHNDMNISNKDNSLKPYVTNTNKTISNNDDFNYDTENNEGQCSLKQVYEMDIVQLRETLTKLEQSITEASGILVNELQSRDQLHQEISAQRTLIEQLVKLQNNCPSLPKQPSIQGSISKSSILV